jgi:hypothetical protein
MSHEEPDAFEEYSEGRDDERAEIVAWMRRLYPDLWRIADCIAEGNHWIPDDE